MSTSPKTPPPSDDDDPDGELELEPVVDSFTLPPGADPTIDWGLTSHLEADGSPKIVERHLVVTPELAAN